MGDCSVSAQHRTNPTFINQVTDTLRIIQRHPHELTWYTIRILFQVATGTTAGAKSQFYHLQITLHCDRMISIGTQHDNNKAYGKHRLGSLKITICVLKDIWSLFASLAGSWIHEWRQAHHKRDRHKTCAKFIMRWMGKRAEALILSAFRFSIIMRGAHKEKTSDQIHLSPPRGR